MREIDAGKNQTMVEGAPLETGRPYGLHLFPRPMQPLSRAIKVSWPSGRTEAAVRTQNTKGRTVGAITEFARSIWWLIQIRCHQCGSYEHLRHREDELPIASVVKLPKLRESVEPRGPTPLRTMYGQSLPCEKCFKFGHCPHRCQSHYWCHDCDGPNCGGGCANDNDCPKRMRVLETGISGRVLYPGEWRNYKGQANAEF